MQTEQGADVVKWGLSWTDSSQVDTLFHVFSLVCWQQRFGFHLTRSLGSMDGIAQNASDYSREYVGQPLLAN